MKLVLALILLLHSFALSLPTSQEIEFVQTRPFERLLEICGISPHLSSKELIAETQRLWFQKGKERWEFDQRYENRKREFWPLFDQMGLLQAKTPLRSHYNYVLVHGSLLNTVKSRVQYLIDLYKQGLCFDQLIFLTGDRSLQEGEKNETGLETEREMVEWVYDRSELPKKIPVLFIDAPKKLNKENIWVRPETSDTIKGWLAFSPIPGSCLAISNQPYVAYQHAVFLYFLPEGFELETVGPAVKGFPAVSVILDTIAKELYWRN